MRATRRRSKLGPRQRIDFKPYDHVPCDCVDVYEVELTISRNLPFMTHVLTPNPEIS